MAFLLGIVTFGLSYNRAISLNNSAREAVRYGAVQPVDGDLDSWLERTADVAVSAATGDLDSGTDGQYVCVAYVYPDGVDTDDRTKMLVENAGVRTTSNGVCMMDGRPASERRVQVVVRRNSNVQAVIYSRNLPLASHSVARFERGEQ